MAPEPSSSKSAKWGDLRTRAITAVILAPLALACIWYGGWPFIALVTVVSIGFAYEWLAMCREKRSAAIVALFLSLPASVVLTGYGYPLLAVLLVIAATAGGWALTGGISWARPVVFGIPYLTAGPVALVWLRRPPVSGVVNVMVLLLLIWASDIGAYVTGRTIGGPKLAPSISPGKTWSGAIGGLIAAGAVGAIAALILGHGPFSWRSTVFAVVVGAISQAGDLLESRLKRHFGVKDSGKSIPGHGGLLDRLDAVLTAAPATALLALVLGPGVILWE